jgi:hypothetical protein
MKPSQRHIIKPCPIIIPIQLTIPYLISLQLLAVVAVFVIGASNLSDSESMLVG